LTWLTLLRCVDVVLQRFESWARPWRYSEVQGLVYATPLYIRYFLGPVFRNGTGRVILPTYLPSTYKMVFRVATPENYLPQI
jgi:hypothetical protein